MCCARKSRNPEGSACCNVLRSCGTRSSKGLAAAINGFKPPTSTDPLISMRGVAAEETG